MAKVAAMQNETAENLSRPNATVWTIADLVAHATAGRLRIPPFQRRFRWDARDVERLFDSVWRGYPIGSLLLWRRRAERLHVEFGPVSLDAPETEEAYWVVDGQQRVTSLVGTLAAPTDVRGGFELYFDLLQQTFRRPGSRRPLPHWLPLRVVVDTNQLLTWLLEYRAEGGSEELVNRATVLGKTIREFQVPVSIVHTEDERFLRDIFDRLNNFGRSLTRAEVFQALHTAVGTGEPADLRSLTDSVADLGFGRLRDDTVLRTVLAIRGRDVFRDFHDEFSDGSDPAVAYHDAAAALELTFRFLQHHAGIPHVRALPYAVAVPALAKFFHLHSEPHPRTLKLLTRWVWRGAIGGVGGGGGATAILRRAVQAVTADEHESAQNLLALIRGVSTEPLDLNATQLNRAAARANLALLSSLSPLSLSTGEAVDVPRLLEGAAGIDGLLRIPDDRGRIPSLAGIFVHEAIADETVADLLQNASDEILSSHSVTRSAVSALTGGSVDVFLKQRYIALGPRLSERRASFAEIGANDRPPLDALFVPEIDVG